MKNILLAFALVLISAAYHPVNSQSKDKQGTGIMNHEAHFMVYDYSSKMPIPNAAIYDNTNKLLGKSDIKGALNVKVSSSMIDLYTIKAEGFNTMSVRLTKANESAADYDIFLPEMASGVLVSNNNETQDKRETMPTDPDLVKVYVKQDPSAYTKSNNEEGQEVEFAVQLSATSRPISDKRTLGSWEELGSVFIHQENGLYKVRIGPFDTQEKAKQVLLQVKERGKKDAFIVVQKGIESHTPFDNTKYQSKKNETEKPDVVTSVAPKSTEVAPKSTETIVKHGEYKVRLASYLKPGGFNTKDIDQYGPLESYRQGEWTIMLIGGFKTANEAAKVRDLVIAKGYIDAKVVVDRDGILETEN